MEENKIKICPKCGKENEYKAFYCSNCAYDFIEEKPVKKKKGKVGIILAVILSIFVILFISVGLYVNSLAKEETFYYNCAMGTYTMIDGAAESEKCCNEILDIWHDCIWQEDDENTSEYTKDVLGNFYEDFNDALNNYSSSDTYKQHVSKIQDNLEEVKGYLNEARKSKIPSKYSKMYDQLEELYELYIEFTNLPIRMNGSYNSFSEDFGRIDDDFIAQYDKVTSYFDK